MATSKSKMASRDMKRRVDVITKKIKDLDELGVPCVFVYATPWTGGLHVFGDDRMTSTVRDHKDEYLQKLKTSPTESTSEKPDFILPRLPQPISEMNGRTLTSLIVGLAKDLDIKWTEAEKPTYWPDNVPFVHPREVPKNLKGKLGFLNCKTFT